MEAKQTTVKANRTEAAQAAEEQAVQAAHLEMAHASTGVAVGWGSVLGRAQGGAGDGAVGGSGVLEVANQVGGCVDGVNYFDGSTGDGSVAD